MTKRCISAEDGASILLISDSDSDEEPCGGDSGSEICPEDSSSDGFVSEAGFEDNPTWIPPGHTAASHCPTAITDYARNQMAPTDASYLGISSSPTEAKAVSSKTTTQQSQPSYIWTAPKMIQPDLPPFTASAECKVKSENMSPIDYFQLFVDDELLEYIVKQTNLYAEQYFQQYGISLEPCSRARNWTETNLCEIKKFLGLTLQMGIVRKPNICSYWSTQHTQTTPIFPAMMSRDRFLLMQRFLHYNDNAAALPQDHPKYDRLYKMRPVIDHLAARFQAVYTPGQNIAVDEPLLLYKRRIFFKEPITSKRAWYGVKLYKLCESSTGYTYRFRISAGKDSCLEQPPCYSPDLSTREKVIWDLVHPLINQGYHLYMDSLYTSLPLFRLLYSKATMACGTIRTDRKGFPKRLVDKKQNRRQTSALRCEELLAVRYSGKREMHLLTTIHDESMSAVTIRRGTKILKPKCVLDYSRHMGGVDRTEQMLQPYNCALKGLVWYKKLVVHLLQLSMLNAFVVYRQSAPANPLSFLKFQQAVITSLLSQIEDDAVIETVENVDRLTGRHFADILPPTEKKNNPCKRCRVCSRKGQRKETRYYCPDCPSKPGLCIPKCYRIYHTVSSYREVAGKC
ncbi:piggyBac transposable element-derived protein 4-like [Rhinophrynus dorsalis]